VALTKTDSLQGSPVGGYNQHTEKTQNGPGLTERHRLPTATGPFYLQWVLLGSGLFRRVRPNPHALRSDQAPTTRESSMFMR